MAKRFTDSAKWGKPFIRSMKAPYKLLWLYILDECDHAGVWQVDFDVAELKIGEKLKIEIAIQQLSQKIIPFDNGEKWFIPDFVDFQYGVLNPENRAHNSVLQILNKYGLSVNNKPHISPLQERKDKDMDMDMVKANSISNIESISIGRKVLALSEFRLIIKQAIEACTFTDKFTPLAKQHFHSWAQTENKVTALKKIKSDLPEYFQKEINYLSGKYAANQIEYMLEIAQRKSYVSYLEKDLPPAEKPRVEMPKEIYGGFMPTTPIAEEIKETEEEIINKYFGEKRS
jgi:hypothetical protein